MYRQVLAEERMLKIRPPLTTPARFWSTSQIAMIVALVDDG
jgi:hypothetical protein